MATVQQLIEELQAIRDRGALAAVPVVRNMAARYSQYVKRDELRRYSHPMFTRTPSPRGAPPAWMTGALSRSITTEVSGGGLSAMAVVGPHTIYASVQEYGRIIRAKHRATMAYFQDGRWHFPEIVDIPARPYMRPAIEATIADGSLERAAMEAFEEVVFV